MLTLKGQLFHIYTTPKGQTKAGDEFGGVDKIKVMTEVPLSNGQTDYRLVDLKVQDGSRYEPHKSEDIEVPVSAFSPAKGQVIFYVTGEPVFS